MLGSDLPSTPVNIGPRSTPSYANLADAAIHDLGGGMQVFAGQRDEGFFVDLGSIFDLATLRPFENLHLIPSAAAVAGRSRTEGFNVHTIAIQAPKSDLTSGGSSPTEVTDPRSTIGVWAAALRQKTHAARARRRVASGGAVSAGLAARQPAGQRGRDSGGHEGPLERATPGRMTRTSSRTSSTPSSRSSCPCCTRASSPAWRRSTRAAAPRADLVAILLTGLPGGLIPGFQNFTGPTPADML